MGDHLESFTTRVWDVGVSRHSGLAGWSMHEEPRGSGDVEMFDPMLTMVSVRTIGHLNNSH